MDRKLHMMPLYLISFLVRIFANGFRLLVVFLIIFGNERNFECKLYLIFIKMFFRVGMYFVDRSSNAICHSCGLAIQPSNKFHSFLFYGQVAFHPHPPQCTLKRSFHSRSFSMKMWGLVVVWMGCPALSRNPYFLEEKRYFGYPEMNDYWRWSNMVVKSKNYVSK